MPGDRSGAGVKGVELVAAKASAYKDAAAGDRGRGNSPLRVNPDSPATEASVRVFEGRGAQCPLRGCECWTVHFRVHNSSIIIALKTPACNRTPSDKAGASSSKTVSVNDYVTFSAGRCRCSLLTLPLENPAPVGSAICACLP